MDDQLGGNQHRKRYQEQNLRLEVMHEWDLGFLADPRRFIALES
jgi:hypothetical protein